MLLPLLGSGGVGEPNGRRGGEVHRVRRPDGTELRVESYGPAGAPALVFTNGWPVDSTEWYYARQELAGPFRVVSLMSREAADELGLEVGVRAVATVKATQVSVDVP